MRTREEIEASRIGPATLSLEVLLDIRELLLKEQPVAQEKKKYICPKCGKECRNAFGLTGHMRSHK